MRPERDGRLSFRTAGATIALVVLLAGAAPAAAAAPASPPPQPAASASATPDFAADIAAAKELQRKGRAHDAIALLGADHKIDPTNRDVTVALAEIYSYSGDQGDAISLLDVLLKASPDDADARIELAQAYAFNHDYAAAQAQYNTVLASAPDDEDAQVGLAQTYTFEGRFSDAKSLFAAILAHDPKNTDAQVGLAGAESFSGDYARAAAEYKAVLATQPDNVDALVGLATVDYWLGDVPAAARLDNRALALDPGDSDATDLKQQLAVKLLPQLVSTNTATHSNDGVTDDYLLQERLYTDPSTSVGLMQELYQISDAGVFVQSHRLGVVATYQNATRFGVDLRVDESRFGGVAPVTDDLIDVTGSVNGFTYGIGQSTGGVDGSVQANGGILVPGQQSALVRIDAYFANAGYTRKSSTLNVTAQDAQYNDGNRFHEETADLQHVFTVDGSTTITPDLGVRDADFSNTYDNPIVAQSPGYYDYDAQRDVTLSATATRQVSDDFSFGFLGTLGERRTIVDVYPGYPFPVELSSPGTLPFQIVEPYADYEGNRFSVTAAYYDYHYAGGGAVSAYASNSASLNVTIRLP
ncbi:MAG TPA: tetratricopeptide repeat protein [Candidatus Eremiobacteraceae bacterium]|nr:tetratricopeptide repeat protein [Candidatus Eremiobacteraceae bacterium]